MLRLQSYRLSSDGRLCSRQAEGQKVEQKQVAAEKQVLSKLQKMQLDQVQRAAALAKDAQAEELQVCAVSARVQTGLRRFRTYWGRGVSNASITACCVPLHGD